MEVTNCTVNVLGGGYLDVTGGDGIQVNNATITVRNVIGNQGNGVSAINGGNITVLGNAQGYSGAVYANGAGSTVTIGGDAVSTGPSSTVVTGNYGAYIEVNGNATTSAANSTGVSVNNSSRVDINGSVSAVQNGVTVYGNSDTQATVDGNVTVSGNNAYGVSASGGGSVEVGGDVSAATSGSTVIYTDDSEVVVNGDVSAGATGVYAVNDSEVTIDGELMVSGVVYIQFKNTAVDSEQYDIDPGNPNYRKYTDDESIVWVKYTPVITNVCEIVGGLQYATLGEALAAIGNGETVTVKLLQNITHNNGIVFNYDHNKKITFDLNGFTLNIINTSGPGLALASGEIDYVDTTMHPGQFNVTGTTHGVYASGNETVAKVTNATATARL